MIDTSLNKKYKANAGGGNDFSPIPEGEYKFKIKEISPWKEQKKTIKVYQKDENGNYIVDSKGEKVTVTVQDCVFYNSMIKLEITEGEYKGRLVFHNITTHPNMNWSIDNLLYALKLEELSAAQIPTICLNMELAGKVTIDKYKKIVQDKETGIDTEQIKEVNKIKSLKPLENPTNNTELNNLGI